MDDRFNPNNSDVKIHSNDGIEFELHRTLLEACTGAFPGLESITAGHSKVIQLAEPGNILSVLFEFIYPREHPDLDDEGFEFVAALADSVMKYEVYSAMFTCNTRMRYAPLNLASQYG
ncbi:hypothetical protein CPB84DRAFT_859943 [Gymnopilus junonius]|uniref:BTB domain-containing protein n=1 Tax=Gymnopilus junonius TaxID=109634 RepID=A0A9P5NQW0_GYMJU|nr:hypothetical protein CPB84DRAFT_859943 [Gymnopilus junonius]